MNEQEHAQLTSKIFHEYTASLASKAMEENAKNGLPIGCAPVGYRNVWTPKGKRIEVDPQTAPLVQEAFRQAANKRSSVQRILDDLTARGFVSRGGAPMHRSGLHKLLRNPFYLGLLPFKGSLYAGQHSPLVSQRLFDQVQERLRSRLHKPGKHSR